MIKQCPYCGTRLKVVRDGELFCQNCGLIDEECSRKENGESSERTYIG